MSDVKVINSWADIGVIQPHGAKQGASTCPECSESRKKKRDKCLSISFDKGVATCHNCHVSFVIRTPSPDFMKSDRVYSNPSFEKLPLSEKTIEFFKSRGIEERTLQYFKVTEASEWMYDKTQEVDGKMVSVKAGRTSCIAFNYYLDGKHVNTKFRASLKRFKLVKEAKLVFYNIDAIKNATECAIQEGEIDTMTAYQCNVFNSISVPNGAAGENAKLEYLDNCIDLFENKTKIVIATDGDGPGRILRDQLIRRFGPEKCWVIEYPEGCKDTNEVLLKYGAEAVRKMYREAVQLPMEGIFEEGYINNRVFDIYDNGFPETSKVGYAQFDKLLSFKGGELTTVTGIPGMGKSTFLDQVSIRLSARHGWRFGIFSPENVLEIHVHKLISKYIGEPTRGYQKMNRDLLTVGLEFVNDHFYFMKYDEIDATIDGILSKARELVKRKGINALVIDPFNCIEHKIPKGYTETQYISELLTKITTFAKINFIHVFLVAHPTKMDKDKNTGLYEVPTLYKISGSANFFAKTHNGFTVHLLDDLVQVHVQKVKFDYVGEKGLAEFTYDKSTGRYAESGSDYENEYKLWKWKQDQLEKQFREGIQGEIEIPPPESVPIREPGSLTDINSLRVGVPASFDFKPIDDAPF